MDRLERLRTVTTMFDLSLHPFYVEWRRGTLPAERLAAYAAAFDSFIGTVAHGWDAAGRPDYAATEREHHGLWRRFGGALGAATPREPDADDTLARVAGNLFRAAPEAVGALYAFEVQQPVTARSKLDGLREHYHLGDAAEEYFRVHADDWDEAKHLQHVMADMPEADFQRAWSACALLGAALWGGLDRVYYGGLQEGPVSRR